MSTISTIISHDIIVGTSGAYASPLTIAASGGVEISSGPVAIYGTAAAKLINHGTVSSPNFGVSFESGLVSNFGYIGGDEGIVMGFSPVVRNRGTVFGSEDGVFISYAGAIANHGEITSSNGFGVVLYRGGSIDNTGVVLGGYGGRLAAAIYAKGEADGTVVNSGTIGGVSGIRMKDPDGTLLNSGTIKGVGGACVYLDAGIVRNTGTIEETGAYYALDLAEGGSILNRGAISGGSGIEIPSGNATITNAGTIAATGSAGVALRFAGGGTDRLIDRPGAVFKGNVIGDGGGSTLELAARKPGSLAGLGTSFQSFGTIEIDPKAVWRLSGDASASTLVNDGKIIVGANQTMVFGTLDEDTGRHGIVNLVGSAAAEFKEAVDKGEKPSLPAPPAR